MTRPEVSIIIPNRNKADFLAQCLTSATSQTLKNIEIIVIDDASEDDSAKIIKTFGKKDKRIKFLQYDSHKTQSQARKDAVKLSQGKYILFLDSDDYIDHRTCEIAASAMNSDDTLDAVCYRLNVIKTDEAISDERVAGLNRMFHIDSDRIFEGDILREVFVQRTLSFTLLNKICKGDLCRQAFDSVKDGHYPKAQDLYAAFFIMKLARKVRTLPETLYHYRFGSGIAGTSKLTLETFSVICEQSKIIKELECYAQTNQDEPLDDVIRNIRMGLTGECFNKWKEQLSKEDKPAGYDILCQSFRPVDIISFAIESFSDQQGQFADLLDSPERKQLNTPKAPKRIGIFYHRISTGGVQNVLRSQCRYLKEAGYHICLLVEEATQEQLKTVIADEVAILQPSGPYSKKNALNHLHSLSNALDKLKLDTLIYHAGSSECLLWDMLLAQSKSIRFIAVHLESFARYIFNERKYDHEIYKVFKIAETVICLSRAAETYYRALGVRSLFIPPEVYPYKKHFNSGGETLIAVGRLDDPIKQYPHLIDILQRVKRDIPNIKLLLVGAFNKIENKIAFEKRAKECDVYENITFCNETSDPSIYYKSADIMVMTSKSEGFSLVLAEAKAHGVPTICYDIPHLELIRDKKGVLVVEQGDKVALADLITKVLSDDLLRSELSKASYQSVKRFKKKFNVPQMWIDMIEGSNISDDQSEKLNPEDLTCIVSHLVQCAAIANK